MYIREEDFKYLKHLATTLDVPQKKAFEGRMLAAIREKNNGEDLKDVIKVLTKSDELSTAIDASELLTRTLIKKVYKGVKTYGA